ncbi:meprin A subunit beta-like [Triplophysa rosa]|uniref:Metalloendopeptidase n=1 Tax=Triplophysa rosa TaxID=992332 RepID=A0A9W7X5B0_TRIRA|nr:meprin A subunit beta-like [Triplophysa rosa]KAI7814402.1 putative meprin A subunit beta-like [Triplophysa rosa]
MILWACVLLSLAFRPASLMQSPDVIGTEVINDEQKDISEINKGLNLLEGDIMVSREKSSILGIESLWKLPVPYVLNSNLSMNYRGVILRAFEQFRLKTCIDFKPRTTEEFYISVEKREGCWSYIGRLYAQGQAVSIGHGCGFLAIVEHEFLHALGFFHEQSRYDRDNYVTIKYENIITEFLNNFNKVYENVSAVQGTPYDYLSVMHYGKSEFSNGRGSTVITKRPEFQDVIGQRVEMSEYDAFELNGLYKCNSSTSFLSRCGFDDKSLCQMQVCSTTKSGWQTVSSVVGVNVTDHTYLGKESNGTSFFMHFSAEGRNESESARLESTKMTPTRDCKVQCLQFYYYHSSNEFDQLNIWIREYQDKTDTRGTLKIMDQITGPPDNHWLLHHVPLNANKTFQLEFEARKGAGKSSGGFSLDDINVSQTECPQIWQIRNFEKLMNDTPIGSYVYSPLYYSSEGYRYQVFLRKLASYYAMSFRLVSGAFDGQLQWPCPWRQVTFQIFDQNPNMQKRMSYEESVTTDPTLISGGRYVWDNPQYSGNLTIIGNESVFVGPHVAIAINKDILYGINFEFIKGGDVIVLISMQDMSGLLQTNSVACPKVKVKNINATPSESAKQGPCFSSSTLLSSLNCMLGLCLLLLSFL